MMNFFTYGDSVQEKEVITGCYAKFFESENMTVAHWRIKKGGEIPEHNHPHEMVVNIVEGVFEMNIDGISIVMRPGDVAKVPSYAMHSAKALTDCRCIDVFYPKRLDYKSE